MKIITAFAEIYRKRTGQAAKTAYQSLIQGIRGGSVPHTTLREELAPRLAELGQEGQSILNLLDHALPEKYWQRRLLITADPHTFEFKSPAGRPLPGAKTKRQQVIKMLKSDKPYTTKEIAAQTGASESYIWQISSKLKRSPRTGKA